MLWAVPWKKFLVYGSGDVSKHANPDHSRASLNFGEPGLYMLLRLQKAAAIGSGAGSAGTSEVSIAEYQFVAMCASEDSVTTHRARDVHSAVLRWGGEAQVDWYEAYADICGERELAYVFCMRSMASGGAFMRFPHASQQAFLEAHEWAFTYFGGVFARCRYDNLGSAVKKILRGHQREETTRFIAFARMGLRVGATARKLRCGRYLRFFWPDVCEWMRNGIA